MLAKIAPTVSNLPGQQIVVEGFTDNVPIGPVAPGGSQRHAAGQSQEPPRRDRHLGRQPAVAGASDRFEAVRGSRGFDQLHERVQHAIGRCADAQRRAAPDHVPVEVIDLAALAAREILRGR